MQSIIFSFNPLVIKVVFKLINNKLKPLLLLEPIHQRVENQGNNQHSSNNFNTRPQNHIVHELPKFSLINPNASHRHYLNKRQNNEEP
jgi:hypothetical protein